MSTYFHRLKLRPMFVSLFDLFLQIVLWTCFGLRRMARNSPRTARIRHWLEFGVREKFGAGRAFVEVEMTLRLEGPGAVIAENPLVLGDAEGVDAVLGRTMVGS